MKRFLNSLCALLLLSGAMAAQCSLQGGNATLAGSLCIGAGTSVRSVTVTPASQTAVDSTTLFFTATATLSNGSLLDVTSGAVWSSSVGTVATIGSAADPWPVLCTSTGNGGTVISAVYAGVSGSTSLSCFPPPTITTNSLPGGIIGTPFSAPALTEAGGTAPFIWAVSTGSLPNGLSLDPITAIISGTPTAGGLFVFTAKVTDANGRSGVKPLSINIASSGTGITNLPQAWAWEQEGYLSSLTGSYSNSWLGNVGGTAITYTNTTTFNNSGGASWSAHGTTYGPYGNTLAEWNRAYADLESVRNTYCDAGARLAVPGTTLSFANGSNTGGLLNPQTTGDTCSAPIVTDSTNPVPVGSNAAGVARIGTYALSSSSGLVRSSNVVTGTTSVPMPIIPVVGEQVNIALTDDRSFTGLYTICGPPTSGCAPPTTSSFTYQQTGSNATTQNGVIWALQAQNPITSMTSAGCSTISDYCTVTVNFASLPVCPAFGCFNVNDRFEITGASPAWFNGTWYVASVGSNQITFSSYTEFIGNISASTPGTVLSKNHILHDQTVCCMYTIQVTGGGSQAIIYADQAHDFHYYDGEVRVAQTDTNETFQLIYLGSLDQAAQSVGSPTTLQSSGCNGTRAPLNCVEPVHDGFDRMYIHGYSFPQVGPTVAMIRGAMKPECGWCYLTNSYLEDINDINSDAEDVGGKSGTGPTKIVNNYIEGGSENFMTGSYQGCNIVNGAVTSSDWEIRRNYATKNQFQCMNAAVKGSLGAPAFKYILKNIDEVKNTARLLRDGNIFSMSCGGAGQQNGALQANNSTEDNGNDAHYEACNSQQGTYDITDTNNTYRHGGGGAYIPGRGGVTLPTVRINENNNLWYDLWDPTRFGRQGWSGSNWGGLGFNWLYEFAARNRTFTSCSASTAVVGGVTEATVTCLPPATAPSMPGMGIATGDLVNVFGCADANYNVLAPSEVTNTNAGGFNSYSITYVVPSGAASSTTGCTIGQAFGWPQYFNFTNNTVVADAGQTNAFYSNIAFNTNRLFVMPNTGSKAANTIARNVTISGNIFSVSGLTADGAGNASLFWNSQVGHSNTKSENYTFDPGTLVLANNLFTGGVTATSNYTEYNCPLGVCGVNNLASPPITDIFLGSGDICSGSPNSSCIGFVGNRATSNPPDFADNAHDYHVFDVPNSFWIQSGQILSGAHLNFTNLDAAQVLKTYVCGTPCGGGPYP